MSAPFCDDCPDHVACLMCGALQTHRVCAACYMRDERRMARQEPVIKRVEGSSTAAGGDEGV